MGTLPRPLVRRLHPDSDTGQGEFWDLSGTHALMQENAQRQLIGSGSGRPAPFDQQTLPEDALAGGMDVGPLSAPEPRPGANLS